MTDEVRANILARLARVAIPRARRAKKQAADVAPEKGAEAKPGPPRTR